MTAMGKKRTYINDVALRDGFQIEPNFIATEEKVKLINRLSRTGLAKIEATSFTSPKAIPNLRDAEQVMRQIERVPGVVYTVLVPNVKGCERALACKVDEINLVMSASQSHNRANLRMSCEQSLAQFAEIVKFAGQSSVFINGSLSTSFGCPFDGWVPERARSGTGAAVSGCRHPGSDAVRYDRHGESGTSTPFVRGGPETLAEGSIHLAFPQHARHGPGERSGGARELECAVSTLRSAGLAVAPTRPAQPEMFARKTWCTCWSRWDTTPLSISMH